MRKGVVALGRCWGMLLVLATVLVVHGLQCAAVDMSKMPGGQSMVGSDAAHGDAAPAGPLPTLPTGGEVFSLAAVASGGAALLVAPSVESGVPGGTDGSARNLWTLCAAVLGAGLAVLIRVLGAGAPTPRPSLVRSSAVRCRHRIGASRSPDLFSLCLLRT